jgi:hypothetical protein
MTQERVAPILDHHFPFSKLIAACIGASLSIQFRQMSTLPLYYLLRNPGSTNSCREEQINDTILRQLWAQQHRTLNLQLQIKLILVMLDYLYTSSELGRR